MTYKRIRELREDHDLTQKYMAHYLNVIQRTYSRYERGERIIPVSYTHLTLPTTPYV